MENLLISAYRIACPSSVLVTTVPEISSTDPSFLFLPSFTSFTKAYLSLSPPSSISVFHLLSSTLTYQGSTTVECPQATYSAFRSLAGDTAATKTWLSSALVEG
jgi:hypothetical protein